MRLAVQDVVLGVHQKAIKRRQIRGKQIQGDDFVWGINLPVYF
jgi:hypothetical protein